MVVRDFQFHIRFGAIECLILSYVKEKKNERDKDKEEKHRKRMRNCGAWRTFRWSKLCRDKYQVIMLGEQFWRMVYHPNSLLAKYFLENPIHDRKPKPHQSWTWKNIIYNNPLINQGRWMIGTGLNITLDHPAWFPRTSNYQGVVGPNLKIVANFVELFTNNWNPNIVRNLYHPPLFFFKEDKMFWRHSSTGMYQIKVYKEQMVEQMESKIHVKIITFVWKILHDCLYVNLNFTEQKTQPAKCFPHTIKI